MYIIIAIAVIFIAVKVPAFIIAAVHHQHHFADRSEAARLHSASAGAIVLTGTDISAGRCGRSDRLHRGIAPAGRQLLPIRCSRTSALCRCGSCFLHCCGGRRAGRPRQRLLRCEVQTASLHRHAVHAADRLRLGADVPYDRHQQRTDAVRPVSMLSYTEFVRGTLFTVRRRCRAEICTLCRHSHGADVGHLEQDHLRQEHVRRRLQ